MRARGFELEISRGLMPDESFEDAATMVDLLATKRAEAGGQERGEPEDYEFALKILCFLFDPVKNPEYESQVRRLRRSFRGIAEAEELRIGFEGTIGDELIRARNVEEALRRPFEKLFVPVYATAGA